MKREPHRPGWSQTPFAQRGAILNRAAAVVEERLEDIARDMTLEMGKPLRESASRPPARPGSFRYFAGEALRPVGEL